MKHLRDDISHPQGKQKLKSMNITYVREMWQNSSLVGEGFGNDL